MPINDPNIDNAGPYRVQGLPFGDTPFMQGAQDAVGDFANPGRAAYLQMARANIPGSINGADYYQQLARRGAQQAPGRNPYDFNAALRATPGMITLLNQMQQQASGPSLASMQAAGASGNALASAIGAQGPNNQAAAALYGANNAVGNDAAQASARQQMEQYNGMGDLASTMRANSQRASMQQAEAGLGNNQNTMNNTLFYSQLGSSIANAQDRAAIERYKALQQMYLQKKRNQANTLSNTANTAATWLKLAGMGV